MTPHDVDRFRQTVEGFIANVAPPFFLIATDRQQNIIITEHDGNAAAKQLCSRFAGPGLASPFTLVVVAADGTVRWGKSPSKPQTRPCSDTARVGCWSREDTRRSTRMKPGFRLGKDRSRVGCISMAGTI